MNGTAGGRPLPESSLLLTFSEHLYVTDVPEELNFATFSNDSFGYLYTVL